MSLLVAFPILTPHSNAHAGYMWGGGSEEWLKLQGSDPLLDFGLQRVPKRTTTFCLLSRPSPRLSPCPSADSGPAALLTLSAVWSSAQKLPCCTFTSPHLGPSVCQMLPFYLTWVHTVITCCLGAKTLTTPALPCRIKPRGGTGESLCCLLGFMRPLRLGLWYTDLSSLSVFIYSPCLSVPCSCWRAS